MQSEKSIFFHAIDLDNVNVRQAYLRKACRGDKKLLAAVSELLREHDRDFNPIDNPAAVALLPTPLENDPKATDDRFAPGTMLGAYKLREQIGEGGFGLVFVADQLSPVRRRVALKIIKPGMESKEIMARFEVERQALAMMDHENIARVFDAGVTDSGQSYFVMELVRGVPLNQFCDNHRLNTEDRLHLFISVCNAVQHAHQKGIIHRDLKPTNVLVTQQDSRPIAKVIDFGVVKAIGQRLSNTTIYTRLASMVGTPAYMSPEQAEMTVGDVDTRSDIYSLGVLLYELLTGSTPLAIDRLNQVGFDELRRIIREEEPLRPSKLLSTLNGDRASTLSANRRMEPAQLESTIRGDLDWIVMKALDKDRNRRYVSAAALAEDVERHLNEQPVEARPPTARYRFSKFARRNRVVLTTISLVAAALLLGSAISVWQARVAIDAMQQANQTRKDLEEFTNRLKHANSLLARGRANAEAGSWAEANSSYTAATQIQPEYFHVWMERGSFYAQLGLWEMSAADYARALQRGSAVDGAEYLGVPQLFLYTGDLASYRELADDLRNSNSGATGTKLRGELMGKPSMESARMIAATAEELIEDSRGSIPSGLSNRSRRIPRGVKLYLAGWAHLAAEQYDQAIERLEQSLSEDVTWAGLGISYPLLAMAYSHVGRDEDAYITLEKSQAALDDWLDESLEKMQGTPPIPWFDWIEFIANHRQAAEMIRGERSPIDPRYQQQRVKAQSVIQ